MVYYILNGHNYEDDVISELQMFYPNTKTKKTESVLPEYRTVVSGNDGGKVFCKIYESEKLVSEACEILFKTDFTEERRLIKLTIFKAHQKIKPVYMPWGILTGIRPAKRITDMKKEGYSLEDIKRQLRDEYLVSEEKIDLSVKVSQAEEKILKDNRKDKIALYFGIPFCPTRCLYCSFTSYGIKQYKDRVQPYIDALEKEMRYVSEIVRDCQIESIYVGGGTPTSINDTQFERFLEMINRYFNVPVEFTVEAGRPDTITKEKLRLLKQGGATRISVNPQTMNDKTLRLIGREHTVEDFKRAFLLAREEGHDHINTDLILGLPGETPTDVENTMKQIAKLSPESVTIHTLAVKRASRLHENLDNFSLAQTETMEKMIDISAQYAEKMNMSPYYMYRQKNMLGNFENVGYAKAGCECIYNVQIMEEKQSVISLGAGGSTKLYFPEENRVERVFNVKSVDDYINRIDEMIERKKRFFQ